MSNNRMGREVTYRNREELRWASLRLDVVTINKQTPAGFKPNQPKPSVEKVPDVAVWRPKERWRKANATAWHHLTGSVELLKGHHLTGSGEITRTLKEQVLRGRKNTVTSARQTRPTNMRQEPLRTAFETAKHHVNQGPTQPKLRPPQTPPKSRPNPAQTTPRKSV